MTEEQIKYSIQTGELKLSNWNKFSHYFIVVFIFLIPAYNLFLHSKDYFQGTPRPLKEGEFWFIIGATILGVLFYRLQKNRLALKSIETNLTRDELDTIIVNVANKLEWKLYVNNTNIIIAKTFPSLLSGSWGEQITIIIDKNRLLINSICDPDKKSSVVSMGRNKKNINTLVEEIKKANH